MVVGNSNRLEIWNPARWAEHYADVDAQAEQMAEELAAGGARD
jgi:DNA-binding transcriptional regulator/RsmH inhibitor MraZ